MGDFSLFAVVKPKTNSHSRTGLWHWHWGNRIYRLSPQGPDDITIIKQNTTKRCEYIGKFCLTHVVIIDISAYYIYMKTYTGMKTHFTQTLIFVAFGGCPGKHTYVFAFHFISQYRHLGEYWDAPLRKTQERYNNVTWAPWCLKTPVSPLFAEQLVPTGQNHREHQSSVLLVLCDGNRLTTGAFPHISQKLIGLKQ